MTAAIQRALHDLDEGVMNTPSQWKYEHSPLMDDVAAWMFQMIVRLQELGKDPKVKMKPLGWVGDRKKSRHEAPFA